MITAVLVMCTTVLVVLVHPQEQPDSYVPSTYSARRTEQRRRTFCSRAWAIAWSAPRGRSRAVADSADAHTVLILAEPTRAPNQQESAAVRQVLGAADGCWLRAFLAAAAVREENLDDQSPGTIGRRHLRGGAGDWLLAARLLAAR